MGYMGFGMQRWLYNRRPRRPFSKDRIPLGDTIPQYTHREIKLAHTASRQKPTSGKAQSRAKVKILTRDYLEDKTVDIFLALVMMAILILLGVSLYHSVIFSMDEQENRKPLSDQVENREFRMAIQYGRHYLKKGDYEMAANEFSTANRVKPDNLEALTGLSRAYFGLCLNESVHCTDAILSITQALSISPDQERILLRMRAEVYLHQGNFAAADKDFERLDSLLGE